jgi:hypothetical protein
MKTYGNVVNWVRFVCGMGLVGFLQVASAVQNTAPDALWIPGLAAGSGKSAQSGAWLLVGADKKPLRAADVRAMQNYDERDGHVLLTVASDAAGQWGYLDTQGQWVLSPQFEEAKAFADDGLARVKAKGLWGYLGKDMKLKVPHQFKEAEGFANGMAAVMVKGKWGFIDTTGALVVAAKYRKVWAFSKNGLARVAVGEDKFGFVDKKGAMVIAPQFDLALEFGDFPVTVAQVKDRWGVIDAQGRWVVAPTYKHLDAFQPPGLAAYEGDDWRDVGFINTSGKVVLAPGRYARAIRQGLILEGSRGGSYFSFADTKGKTVIPGPFEWSHDFHSDKPWVVARRKGAWGLVLRNGQWLAAGEGREPLWVHGEGGYQSRTLSMWLHAGQAIEWKNVQGQTVYRLTERVNERAAEAGKPVVWQLHAGNALVWTSPPQAQRLALKPTFEPREVDVSQVPGQDWVGTAQKLLAQKPRRYLPYSLVFGERRDAYDLQGVDADEQEQVQTGAFAVLAQTYVDEGMWGEYYYLGDQRWALFRGLQANICTALRSAFGPALNDGQKDKQYRDGNVLACEWKVGDKLLTLVHYAESGDGDFEHQLRLYVQGPAVPKSDVQKKKK